MTKDKRILLEDLQRAVGCTYLSDLYMTSKKYSKEIICFIERIADEDYELDDWIRTVEYITNTSETVNSIKEAKNILLKSVK